VGRCYSLGLVPILALPLLVDGLVEPMELGHPPY
jgi:hypothetical protein